MFENITNSNILIDKIDVHTGHLTELLSKVYHCFTEGYSAKKCESPINELTNYAICQFAWEEQWMSITMYEEKPTHKEEHLVFINDLTEMLLRLPKDDGGLALDNLLILIQRLTQHVLVTDGKYRQFITDKTTTAIRLSEYALFACLKKLESLTDSDEKITEVFRPTLIDETNDHISSE